MGFSVYRLEKAAGGVKPSARLHNGRYIVETDLYKIEIDPSRGGVITSLIAKGMGQKQMVDAKNARGFNELRGYFHHASAWRSSMDTAAAVRIPGR